MKKLVEKEKINLATVPAYISNVNGAAERLNRDLDEKIRCLLISSGFPKELWAYALRFAVDIYN